ncbi:MAG: ABC transporter substrate-binding protein [Magnetococcales bacterium]|nr:ABC transporter substrate-binding protein [Magnetococcales bacterium]NGZ27624.1 ABC transporter substrate-binding protein [Magnetococcales bacterium]
MEIIISFFSDKIAVPSLLKYVVLLLLVFLLGIPPVQAAESPLRITVSLVGPRNLSYLPIDLIPRIGIDQEEGVQLILNHVGGGGVAIKQTLARNSDFAVAGFPAVMSLKANGGTMLGVASVSDATLFVLIVRAALQDEVKRIADLKGRVIGIHNSSVNAKTVAQQLTELLLFSDGGSEHDIRMVPVGQNWEERALLLENGKVDAIMAEEPFASVMIQEKKVFALANLADPAVSGRIPGSHFLHAAVTTRPDVIQNEPVKVQRMVTMVRRALQWIASHTPEELVEKMAVADEKERQGLLLALKKYPRLYSPNGAFSRQQMADTNQFFKFTNPKQDGITMESLIHDQWAGQRE